MIPTSNSDIGKGTETVIHNQRSSRWKQFQLQNLKLQNVPVWQKTPNQNNMS